MPTVASRRLKRLRRQSGLSVRAMAKLLAMPPSSYQYYETAYDKAVLPLELGVRVRPVLLRRGVAPEDVDRLCPFPPGLPHAGQLAWASVVDWDIAAIRAATMTTGESMAMQGQVPIPTSGTTTIALRVDHDEYGSTAPCGSYVVVDWSAIALEDGRIYLVRTGSEAILARYHRETDSWRPLSRKHRAEQIARDEIEVIGRLVYVVHPV